LGLLTVLDGLAAVGLHLAVKVFGPPPTGPPTLTQQARTYNNQLLLILVSAAALTGFTDLGSIAVSLTQVVPFELALSIGFGLASIYTIGSTITQLDGYLELRDARLRKKGIATGGSVGDEGRGDLKEKSFMT
jgi:hypothetical protein